MKNQSFLVGVCPPYIYAEECRIRRLEDLTAAVNRYMRAMEPVPARWLQEYAELLAAAPTEDLQTRSFNEAYGPGRND